MPERGQLAEHQVTVESKEKVLDALSEAASKLRGELGESLASVQKLDVPLEQATTSSLEALKAYSLGAASDQGASPWFISNVPSSSIRILPWQRTKLVCAMKTSASQGGPKSTTPRRSSCASVPVSGKSWLSLPTTMK